MNFMKENTKTKSMKLYQDMSNPFGRYGLKPKMDCDLVAIKLLRSNIKITEKDVEGYIQHLLTYIHPKIDNTGVGWMKMIGKKHDDPEIKTWISGVLKSLKAVVRSYDSKLASSIFKDKHLEEKYHLGSGFSVTTKTAAWVKTCTIVKTPKKKVEAELDKNIEIRNRIFDKFADKNEGSQTIGSATHSELDDVVAPLVKIEKA
jgi:hypothetical protein